MGRSEEPLVSDHVALYWPIYVDSVEAGGSRRVVCEWAGAAPLYLLIPPPGKKSAVHDPGFGADR